MSLKLKLKEILDLFPEAQTSGDYQPEFISGISSLEQAESHDLSFLGNPKYRKFLDDSNAGVILLPEGESTSPKDGQLFIFLDSPSTGLASICRLLEDKLFPAPKPGLHPTSFKEEGAQIDPSSAIGAFCYVGENAVIGEKAIIGTHCHVGRNVIIGKGCRLHPGVKILSNCVIGNDVVINAGVIVGSEGYGFEQDNSGHQKIPHLGKVIIEDNVEIGANTCIDRARFDETRIGKGTKIDNLVQVGHNVQIGKNCLIVAQVGISGSVVIEDDVIVGGQAGFAGHLRVGKGAKIAGQSGITKSVEPGAFLKGNPALPFQLAQRISVLQRKLPDLFNRFAQENSKD